MVDDVDVQQKLDRWLVDGSSAASPSMPVSARAWWEILSNAAADVSRTNLSLIAGGVAFFAFLAIPSALGALLSLYGLAFDPADAVRQIQRLEFMLPEQATQVLSAQLAILTSHSNTTLGVGFMVTFGFALWSARSATSSLISALNVAYDEPELRGFLRFELIALGWTLCGLLAGLVSLILVAMVPAVLGLLPVSASVKAIVAWGRWPILLAFTIAGFAALYRLAPCHAGRCRRVRPGAVAAAVLWIAGSAAFSAYVANVASYDKTYGSLGSVIALMMWLYLSVFVLLLGAELNGEIDRRTSRARRRRV